MFRHRLGTWNIGVWIGLNYTFRNNSMDLIYFRTFRNINWFGWSTCPGGRLFVPSGWEHTCYTLQLGRAGTSQHPVTISWGRVTSPPLVMVRNVKKVSRFISCTSESRFLRGRRTPSWPWLPMPSSPPGRWPQYLPCTAPRHTALCPETLRWGWSGGGHRSLRHGRVTPPPPHSARLLHHHCTSRSFPPPPTWPLPALSQRFLHSPATAIIAAKNSKPSGSLLCTCRKCMEQRRKGGNVPSVTSSSEKLHGVRATR